MQFLLFYAIILYIGEVTAKAARKIRVRERKEINMKCPACGSGESHVLDSRHTEEGNSIRRRRACAACGKRFTTYEVIETTPLVVIKKNGTREFFDRHKLKSGLLRACQKRQVDVEEIVSGIEKELQNSLDTEVTTGKIGEMVMERLRQIDAVSYVRFASVYREFKDADTFLAELNKLLRLPPEKEPAKDKAGGRKRKKKEDAT